MIRNDLANYGALEVNLAQENEVAELAAEAPTVVRDLKEFRTLNTSRGLTWPDIFREGATERQVTDT